jgi:hypothetical protein
MRAHRRLWRPRIASDTSAGTTASPLTNVDGLRLPSGVDTSFQFRCGREIVPLALSDDACGAALAAAPRSREKR